MLIDKLSQLEKKITSMSTACELAQSSELMASVTNNVLQMCLIQICIQIRLYIDVLTTENRILDGRWKENDVTWMGPEPASREKKLSMVTNIKLQMGSRKSKSAHYRVLRNGQKRAGVSQTANFFSGPFLSRGELNIRVN